MHIDELMEVQQTCASEDNEVGDIILPGFRFHPTEEELIGFYLRRQVKQRDLMTSRRTEHIELVGLNRSDPWDMPRGSLSQRLEESAWQRYARRPRQVSRSAVTRPWHAEVTRPNRPEDLHAVCPHCDSTRTKPCFKGSYSNSSSRHCESCHHCWPHRSPISHSPFRTFFYATEYNHARPDSCLPTHSFSQTVGGQSSPAQHVSIDIPDVDDTVEPNRILQPYRLTDDKWVKLAEIVLGISAAAGYTSSSSFPKAANAAGFLASLTAISLCYRIGRAASQILIKFGAGSCAAGILAAIGNDLPDEYRWIAAVAFLIPATAVAFA